jgi:hypothetical protein
MKSIWNDDDISQMSKTSGNMQNKYEMRMISGRYEKVQKKYIMYFKYYC